MEGIELPNLERIRILRENETYNYSGILEADIIKQVEMKKKIKKSVSDKRKCSSKLSFAAEISSKG